MRYRILSLSILMMAIAVGHSAYAYDFSAVAPSGQTLYYKIVSGNAEVTYQNGSMPRYTTLSGILVIPTTVTYGGVNYTVTGLSNDSFQGCTNLTSVTIPNSVTYIGSSVFSECSSLTSVSIPNSVTSIGNWAFYLCSSLTSLIIPNSVTNIGIDAIRGCSNLTSVVLGNSVTNIAQYAFAQCSSLSEITSLAAVAPSIVNYGAYPTFSGVNSSIPVRIPNGSLSSYQSNWSCFSNFIEISPVSLQFSLIVNSNDSTWGTGSHIALGDSIAEVTATANYGYHFDHWNYGSTANPDTLLLSSDVTITAIFAKNQYTVTGISNDDARGSVAGSATVDYLDSVTLMATPNYGFHFQRWSDYHTENPRTVAATGDINLTAAFDLNQYTITLAADTSIHGTVSGAGEYNYLSEHNISATANYGYHFAHWNDGNTDNPRTITLTQDTHFVAIFERNTYSLTANVNDVALGSVSFPDGDSALYLDTLRVVATPMAHRHVVSWTGPGITATSTNKDTVWVAMTENRAVSCTFAIDTHTVVTTVNDIARGMVTQSGTEFVYGTPCTVEATAYTGYIFAGWSNGVTETPYTFAVLEDVELTAIFLAPGEETYTITVNSNATTMGTATVNGGATATVMCGETVTLTATANSGYRFTHWNDNDTNAVRTIIVTEDMDFTAYFEPDGSTESIRDAEAISAKIYSNHGQVVVENADGHTVTLYDAVGRLLAVKRNESDALRFDVPASGTYLVKVGSARARRIVVVK